MAIECKHGRLARKCEFCELSEAYNRIAELEAERDKAVELLRGECEIVGCHIEHQCDHCKALHDFLASIGGEGKNG